MEATRPQPIVLEGLSSFLLTHGRCASGFDIAHPAGAGSGRVSIRCRGCGSARDYATASIEIEREIRIERIPEAPGPEGPRAAPIVIEPPPAPRIEPAAGSPPASRIESPAGSPSAPRVETPGESPPVGGRPQQRLALALFVLAMAAILFTALLVSRDDGERTEQPAPSESANAPDPPPAPPTSDPAGFAPLAAPAYTLRLPPGWRARRADGGLLVTAPGGRATLAIFSRRRASLGWAAMADASARLLAERNPGAALSPGRRVRLRGLRGFSVVASTAGRRETAVGVLAGAKRFLLIKTLTRGATPAERRETYLVQESFRPR